MGRRLVIALVPVGLAAALLLLVALHRAPASPLAGQPLYLDEAAHNVRFGDERLRQPTARWLAEPDQPVEPRLDVLLADAHREHSWPVLVVYGVPHRDCGLHSQGGATDADQYLGWVRAIGSTIGERRAIVIVEPDAVPLSVDGCLQDVRPLLAQAVGELRSRAPNARLYLDAGNATWIGDLSVLRRALVEAGLSKADGFSVNVSNVVSTQRSVEFAEELGEGLPVRRFVVDTSRSGAEVPEAPGSWCNNRDARVGEEPTTDVSQPYLDALLWVKPPGDSDGDCGRGEPPAGRWWQEYAEALLGP